MVSMGDLVSDKEWEIINDYDHSWQEDHTVPEREVEQSEVERSENTNLMILEWIYGLPADDDETLSIQPVDISERKHVKEVTRCSVGWRQTDH